MSTSDVIVAITVAVVGTSGIPVYFLKRFDRRNTYQHAENQDLLKAMQSDLQDVKADTSEVKSSLIHHLQHHLEVDNGFEGRVAGVTGSAEVSGSDAGSGAAS